MGEKVKMDSGKHIWTITQENLESFIEQTVPGLKKFIPSIINGIESTLSEAQNEKQIEQCAKNKDLPSNNDDKVKESIFFSKEESFSVIQQNNCISNQLNHLSNVIQEMNNKKTNTQMAYENIKEQLKEMHNKLDLLKWEHEKMQAEIQASANAGEKKVVAKGAKKGNKKNNDELELSKKIVEETLKAMKKPANHDEVEKHLQFLKTELLIEGVNVKEEMIQKKHFKDGIIQENGTYKLYGEKSYKFWKPFLKSVIAQGVKETSAGASQ